MKQIWVVILFFGGRGMVEKVIIDKTQAVYVFSKLSHCILNLKNRKHHMLFDLLEIVLYIHVFFIICIFTVFQRLDPFKVCTVSTFFTNLAVS